MKEEGREEGERGGEVREEMRRERGGLGGEICNNVALGTAPGIGDRIPYVIIQGPKGTHQSHLFLVDSPTNYYF